MPMCLGRQCRLLELRDEWWDGAGGEWWDDREVSGGMSGGMSGRMSCGAGTPTACESLRKAGRRFGKPSARRSTGALNPNQH